MPRVAGNTITNPSSLYSCGKNKKIKTIKQADVFCSSEKNMKLANRLYFVRFRMATFYLHVLNFVFISTDGHVWRVARLYCIFGVAGLF